jgi:predicted DNA-binding protein
MGNTLTIRLTEELEQWLRETSRKTGVPVGRIVREQLEKARAHVDDQPFMKHAGSISGPSDLSSRKGLSRR